MNISAVERETGLSKDVLRMWERRYGFPHPGRDRHDERQYGNDDVAKLRAIKRLMDSGLRPGKLIQRSLSELTALADTRVSPRATPARAPGVEASIVALLRAHDLLGVQRLLSTLILQRGLQRFVIEHALPMGRAVDDAWMRGSIDVFEERFYTEQMLGALRSVLALAAPRGGRRVLLTTLPGEAQALSLLMIEALLVPEGVHCVSLGPQTPLESIARAAQAYDVHAVALALSSTFPPRQAMEALTALRTRLAPAVGLWAGGDLVRRPRKSLAGVEMVHEMEEWLMRVKRTAAAPAAR